MRILVLAPHPFYIVRGTPIDLELVVRVLSRRPAAKIDLVVYNEGEERTYPNVTIHRTRDTKLTRNLRPGFTIKKLLCDAFMFFKAWSLIRQNEYDLIHAGEEAVYMAMLFRRMYGVPYAYDLDSSLAEQMTEKIRWLRPAQGLLNAFERAAIRGAVITFPVCNSLADLCIGNGSSRVVTLHDISQLKDPDRRQTGRLKRELGIEGLILLYAGNLEPYQGVDLLLEGFAGAAKRTDQVDLVIVGGSEEDIGKYRKKAESLGVGSRSHFIGPKPFEQLDEYLAEADILTAPRIKGRNTPMKVFPYLHSGRALLVTDLPTHSQIISNEVAMLAKPTAADFAEAILTLARDDDKRRLLGGNGRAFVEANHTYEAHRARLNDAYDWIEHKSSTASTGTSR